MKEPAPRPGRLTALAEQLQAQGVDPGRLAALQGELNALTRPPTGRLGRAQEAALRQWRHAVGELQESLALARLLRRRLGGHALSPAEREEVRAQLLDVVRIVPAGLVAFANYALPVPGTSVFTPWLLARMGLMPSRWREAHLLTQLQAEHDRLAAAGEQQAAQAVADLQHTLEEEAAVRERAALDQRLLRLWDQNSNGTWDPEERAAYAGAVAALHRHDPALRRWYLSLEGHVFGPLRLSDLDTEALLEAGALVCFDGRSGWVALRDLSAAAVPPSSPPDADGGR